MKYFITVLFCLLAATITAQNNKVIGTWEGKINVGHVGHFLHLFDWENISKTGLCFSLKSGKKAETRKKSGKNLKKRNFSEK